jgi:hypothetical protein
LIDHTANEIEGQIVVPRERFLAQREHSVFDPFLVDLWSGGDGSGKMMRSQQHGSNVFKHSYSYESSINHDSDFCNCGEIL